MAYAEFAPRRQLADLVTCTWQRSATVAGEHRVVPDSCVDLVWDGEALTIAGPDTSAWLSRLEAGAEIVGLRFRPGVAGAALALPASELRDARVALSDVWGPSAAELEVRLWETAEPRERRRLLEAAVFARRADTDEPDRLVLAALKILGLPGSRVRAAAERLALSDRQLLRRFKAAVGYGPKTLDRVLRFQRFLARKDAIADGDEGLARLAAELGYADQAHLTRDCVALSGLTPAALVRARPASQAASQRLMRASNAYFKPSRRSRA